MRSTRWRASATSWWAEKSTGTDKDATAFKTAAELKSDAMLTTLGDAFKKDAGNVNNGYPVLVWQVSEACTDHTPGAAVRENEVPATCTKDGSHDEVIYSPSARRRSAARPSPTRPLATRRRPL